MSTSVAPYLLYTKITSQVDFVSLAPPLKNGFYFSDFQLIKLTWLVAPILELLLVTRVRQNKWLHPSSVTLIKRIYCCQSWSDTTCNSLSILPSKMELLYCAQTCALMLQKCFTVLLYHHVLLNHPTSFSSHRFGKDSPAASQLVLASSLPSNS